ncbi:PREDICTED: ras-related protein Rab-3D-like, partial [Tinamus guttatus]|uniref:ras-related protein Rab-3D-like n=1 Tax=Tinamus guttatus TaxID=94827 RepID=UPI00052EE8E3
LKTNVYSYLKEERINSVPDHLFKIILVGNSSVGKTSFLRRFCEDRFFPGTAATVGKFKKHYKYYYSSSST